MSWTSELDNLLKRKSMKCFLNIVSSAQYFMLQDDFKIVLCNFDLSVLKISALVDGSFLQII